VRLLLVDPPFYRFVGYYSRYFPYGLVSIATALRRKGHEVEVLNADQDPKAMRVDFSNLPNRYPAYLREVAEPDHPLWLEFRRHLDRYRPDAVGFTCLTPKVASVIRAVGVVKAWRRECPVIAGGPHATARAQELRAVAPELDAVVVGEGEQLADEVARAVDGGQGFSVPVLGPSPPLPQEKLGAVDRSVLEVDRAPSSEDMGLIMTSRGCPYACGYCFSETMWGRTVRRRHAGDVVDEMQSVADAWGTTQFTFKDDCFTLRRDWVVAFCQGLLARQAGWNWDCCTRIDLIDEGLLNLMARSGCNSIKVGLESGSPRMLELIGRGYDVDMMVEAGRMLRSSGIHWTGYFMIGLPGETERDIEATVTLMERVRPDFASLSTYEPLPGTRLFEMSRLAGDVRDVMGREDFFTILPNRYYLADPDRSGLAAMGRDSFAEKEREVKHRFGRYNRSTRRLLKRGWARRRLYSSDARVLRADVGRALRYLRGGR
jgi:anaerobic magnesium-protoporphyrin IX monomethyl ester cyclase